jgi:hypothetical protein
VARQKNRIEKKEEKRKKLKNESLLRLQRQCRSFHRNNKREQKRKQKTTTNRKKSRICRSAIQQ